MPGCHFISHAPLPAKSWPLALLSPLPPSPWPVPTHTPPPGYFLTKIFHPNVSASGEICVNVLKRDWKPDLGLRHVLTVIRCLLIEPNAESGAGQGVADGTGRRVRRQLMGPLHGCIHAQ